MCYGAVCVCMYIHVPEAVALAEIGSAHSSDPGTPCRWRRKVWPQPPTPTPDENSRLLFLDGVNLAGNVGSASAQLYQLRL